MRTAFRLCTALFAAALALVALGTAGCAKRHDDVSIQLEREAPYGNVLADAFFDAGMLRSEGIAGRMILTVAEETTPEPTTRLLLLDFSTQSMKTLTTGTAWARSPKFLPSGTGIVYCTGEGDYSRIAVLDLKTGRKRVVSPDDGVARFDPEPISDTRIVYDVFPEKGDFYLAELDLETGRETTLSIRVEGAGSHNFAVRASEPAYDRSTGSLYFVSDQAFAGAPKPINVFRLDLESGIATQVTHNTVLKVSELDGKKIASPQLYDLDVAGPDELIFGLRAIEKHNEQESPHFSGCEIHLANLREKTDSQIYSSDKLVRSPVKVTDKYFAIFIQGDSNLVLVNFKNRSDTFKLLSDIPVVGDADYFP